MKRLALVSGGTRGIGRAIATTLYSEGHQVIASYVSSEKQAESFREETGMLAVRFDVKDWEGSKEVIEGLVDEYGEIDILVNNAGITRDKTLIKMSYQDWSSVIETNLTSCFILSKLVLGGMISKRYGRIVNISSVNALKGQRGQTNYSAAKSGMIGFTKSLALEVANKGITVNCVSPGYINTEMVQAIDDNILAKIVGEIPAQRLGMSEEVGSLVAYLCSDKGSYITGSTFSINGGLYMQ